MVKRHVLRSFACIAVLGIGVCAPVHGGETPGLGIHGAHSGLDLGLAATLGNPAANAVLSPSQPGARFAFQLVGVSLEAGPVNDFMEEIEDLEDDLDRESLTQEEAAAIIARVNPLLVEIGKKAYANVGVNVFSVVGLSHAWGGWLSWSFTPERLNKVTILDAPVTYDDQAEQLDTDTAVMLRTATSYRFGMAYTGELAMVSEAPAVRDWYWGARLNLAYSKLDRIAASVNEPDSGTEATDDAEYDLNRGQGSVGIGADLGILYRHPWFHTGATVYNAIPAKHDFATIASAAACPTVPDEFDRDTCVVAQAFPGRLPRKDSVTDKPKLTGEFVFRAPESHWTVGTSLDLTKGESFFGDEQQFFSFSGGYSPQRFWIPGFSLSYRQNLAGSELSTYGVGLNLFGFLRLDARAATESVSVDGDTYPRDVSFGLSFQHPL